MPLSNLEENDEFGKHEVSKADYHLPSLPGLLVSKFIPWSRRFLRNDSFRYSPATDAHPFSPFRGSAGENLADRERRIGSKILPHPGHARAEHRAGEILPRTGREPALRRDRAVPRRSRSARAEDLFSRSGGRTDLDRRSRRTRPLELSGRKLADPARLLRVGPGGNREVAPRVCGRLCEGPSGLAGAVRCSALSLGAKLLFRELPRSPFWRRPSETAGIGKPACPAGNCRAAGE